MGVRLSSAGMFLAYCAETTANTMPTSEYVVIPEVKSMPNFNPSPATIDSTTLLETEYHTYVAGLKDLGGALEYGANLTDELEEIWGTLMTAFEAAARENKGIWFAVVHPKMANAVFYRGEPSPIGLNEASVDSMAETTLYITPVSAPVKKPRPGINAASKNIHESLNSYISTYDD